MSVEADEHLKGVIKEALRRAGELLCHACDRLDLDIVQELIAAGAPVDHRAKIDDGGGREASPLARVCQSRTLDSRVDLISKC